MPDDPNTNEFGAGYGGQGNVSGLKDIHDMFYALSSELKVCTNNISNFMRTTTTIQRTTFFVLTKEQDDDLFGELAHVNELLAEARTELNAYITIENSLPDFKVFFNTLHDIEEMLDTQKNTIFFHVHVRDDEKCLYPKKEIENKIKMFKTMVGGVCGTLKGVGNFVLHSPIIQGAGEGSVDVGYSNGHSTRRNIDMGAPAYQEEYGEEPSLGM